MKDSNPERSTDGLDLVKYVIDNWASADISELPKLVKIMIMTPSLEWRELMNRAEKHEIVNWEILLQNSSDIYASIAEAIAEDDGIVFVNKD